MKWPWQLEEEHYEAVRAEALEPNALFNDTDLWMSASLGGWLPLEKRAKYLEELQQDK
jgi:hypothetical protein